MSSEEKPVKEPFDKRQIKDFVKQAKWEWGMGWNLLGERFQRAMIAERALCIIGNQASETVETSTLHWLMQAMFVEAGLADSE